MYPALYPGRRSLGRASVWGFSIFHQPDDESSASKKLPPDHSRPDGIISTEGQYALHSRHCGAPPITPWKHFKWKILRFAGVRLLLLFVTSMLARTGAFCH
jgi:hypothetical protein